MRFYLMQLLQVIVDLCFTLIPRRRPTLQALIDCRIVAHRGEHDNRKVRENTMPAFAAAAAARVWGIEFDLRWTRDLQPVVIHDTDTERVFETELIVSEVSLGELRRQVPGVPTLVEVVAEFGGDLHLMVELKQDDLGHIAARAARLAEVLSSLEAVRDYHFLALRPQLFDMAAFAGNEACLLVAETNTRNFSRQAIIHGFGGLCGHYLLLSNRLLGLHHRQGQKLGTGFASSRFCFYRELNRGVDWVFTNRARRLGAIRARLLRQEASRNR